MPSLFSRLRAPSWLSRLIRHPATGAWPVESGALVTPETWVAGSAPDLLASPVGSERPWEGCAMHLRSADLPGLQSFLERLNETARAHCIDLEVTTLVLREPRTPGPAASDAPAAPRALDAVLELAAPGPDGHDYQMNAFLLVRWFGKSPMPPEELRLQATYHLYGGSLTQVALLRPAQLLELLAPWSRPCTPNTSGLPQSEEMQACLAWENRSHSGHRHPLTSSGVLRNRGPLRELDSSQVFFAHAPRTREIAQRFAATPYMGTFAWLRGATLIRGPRHLLEHRLPERQGQYLFMHMAVSQVEATPAHQLAAALGWLLPKGPRSWGALVKSCGPDALSDAAGRIALPELPRQQWMASKDWFVGPWLRDALRVPVQLKSPDAREAGVAVLLAGTSGDGATSLCRASVLAHLAHGNAQVWMISRDTSPLLAHLGGTQTVALRLDAPQSLNPLAGMETEQQFHAHARLLSDWLLTLAGLDTASASQDLWRGSLLDAALDHAWKEQGADLGLEAVLSAIHQCDAPFVQEEREALAKHIREGLQGLDSAWFEGRPAFATDGQLVDINLADELVQSQGRVAVLVRTLLALHATHTTSRDPRAKAPTRLFVLDDAEMLGEDGAQVLVRRFFEYCAHSPTQVLLTSRPFDPRKDKVSPMASWLYENCRQRVLLSRHNPEGGAAWLGHPDAQTASRVANLNRGHMLWDNPYSHREPRLVTFHPGNRAWAVLSPTPQQHETLRQGLAQGHSLAGAVEELIRPGGRRGPSAPQ